MNSGQHNKEHFKAKSVPHAKESNKSKVEQNNTKSILYSKEYSKSKREQHLKTQKKSPDHLKYKSLRQNQKPKSEIGEFQHKNFNHVLLKLKCVTYNIVERQKIKSYK